MQTSKRNEDYRHYATLVAGNTGTMLAYCDKYLVCRFANAAYLRWLGKAEDEVVNCPIVVLLPGILYEQYRLFVSGVLTGRAQHFELTLLAQDGSNMRHEQVGLYPDADDGGVNGFVMHVTDITRQRQQRQVTEEANTIIVNQNKSLQNFANIVSHNLRSYAGNLQTLLGMYEAEDDPVERYRMFSFLKDLSVDLRSSVENLGEIVKVQNLGKVPVEQVNLHLYVVKATELLRVQVEASKAVIHNNIGTAVQIEANAAYVESIVVNFIDNAIKYRHPDRTPEIELSTIVAGNETVLNIRDNGLGINLEKYRRNLYGLYNTFHGNENATGLGLFMVKQQVDNMGGYIGVESEVGEGTWFRIYFKTRAVAV